MSNLLNQLRQRKDDRGLMANLRCGLVESKKQMSWPALNRLGVDLKDEVAGLIAGLFATHPEESGTGNFGDTCKRVENKRDQHAGNDKDSKLTPTEKRFLHLLSAENGNELHERVIRMVLMAKSKGVPINYEQLEKDLRYWNERTKTEWASAFWTSGLVPEADKDTP